MDRFLIIAPHTPEGCVKTLKRVESIGAATHFDWGCTDGEHCGWAIIEAESTSQALLVVPSFERRNARAIKLARFNPEEIRKMHEE